MESFQDYMKEYIKQLKKGDIKKAYKGLMIYLNDLRLFLKTKYPDYIVSGSIQNGYLDYSYFYFFPKSLRRRKLRIVIFFIHDTLTFEVWLAGFNKNVQTKYWKLFTEESWNKYPVAQTTRGVDYIINNLLMDNADFSDLDILTKQIEKGTLKFIKDIESFLSKH